MKTKEGEEQNKLIIDLSVTEIAVGLGIASLLTLVFLTPLNRCGKASACLLSAGLPLSAQAAWWIRTALKQHTKFVLPRVVVVCQVGGMTLILFGFILLLQNLYWPAAAIFAASCVAAIIFLPRQSRVKQLPETDEQERRQQNNDVAGG